MPTPTRQTEPDVKVRLTPARRRALEALAAHHPRPCRRTSFNPQRPGHVYWQSADWLQAQGLAVIETMDGTWDHQVVTLTDAGVALALAEGLKLDPQPQPVDHEAQVTADLTRAAQDLYRGMNDSLSQHLAQDPGLRRLAFEVALDLMDTEAAAGKPLDLLRAFTEAVMAADPTYSTPDPAEGPADLTAEELAARPAWLTWAATNRPAKEVMPS